MHGLVRDLACHIMGHKCMVKCEKELTEIPHISKWTADLDVVSLARNNIREIPADMSPQSPNLSTLIFSGNLFSCIPDCFFDHMNTLLDLSRNEELKFLPDSVSRLRSLVSLLLRYCAQLQYIPPLGELKKLSRLDISNTSIEKVPEGLEKLINLKWLDLSWNRKLTMEPRSVLPSLVNMQFLDLLCCMGSTNVCVKVEDVQELGMLNYFACCFQDSHNLNGYVRETLQRGYGPKTYHLHLGIDRLGWRYLLNERGVSFGDCQHSHHFLPICLTKLKIENNKQWIGCLCDALSFKGKGPSSLRHISLSNCSKIESLFCLSDSCYFCSNLNNLHSMCFGRLESFDGILKKNYIGITQHFSPRPGGFFSHLKFLRIWSCNKMEELFIAGSLPQLPNLEEIEVSSCNSMKEIFLTEDDHSTITLQKLTALTLNHLPQLKVVCRGILASQYPPKIEFHRCPKLERLPTVQVTGFCVPVRCTVP